MLGVAEFIQQKDSKYLFKEFGAYELNNESYNFFQNYIFYITKNKLTILKKDETILHEFVLPKDIIYPIKLSHTHHCGKDTYQGIFAFVSSTYFKTTYKILGPNKNYTISTTFEKVSD